MSDKVKPKPRLENPYAKDDRLTTQLWVRIPWEDFARLRNIDIKKGIFQKTFAYLFHKIVTECKKRNIQDYADIERYENLILGLDFAADVDVLQPSSGGTVTVPDGQTVYFSDGRRTTSAGGPLAESETRPDSEPKKRAPSRPSGPSRRPTGRKKA